MRKSTCRKICTILHDDFSVLDKLGSQLVHLPKVGEAALQCAEHHLHVHNSRIFLLQLLGNH